MNIYSIGKDFSVNLKKTVNKNSSKKKDSLILIAKYSSIGYYLVTPLILGVFIGFGLDSFFSTKPFFTISGIIFGSISVFYHLYKLIKDN